MNNMIRGFFRWLKQHHIGAVVAAVFGGWSLYKALDPTSTFMSLDHRALGKLLIGIWGLLPPIFFWLDWVCFCRDLDKEQQEFAKHTHDLGRNVWLALLAVLAILFELKLP
jgi:hypothetical protein